MDTFIDTWATEALSALTDARLGTVERLSARAVQLGLVDDVDAADVIIGHHLRPVIGWVRMNEALGLPAEEFFRDSWASRVAAVVVELKARWA